MYDQTGFWGQAGENPAGKTGATVPHSSRVWNFWLGGKDYYAADREAGAECLARFPGITGTVRCLRYFTARLVRCLAGEAGICQFLDIGPGLPFHDPVHQIAQDACSACRVVYADNDPVVLAHARALLTGPPGTVGYLDADLTDPATLLDQASALLDFTRPVAVLLISALGHIGDPGQDDDQAARLITGQLTDALPPGSYLAIGDLVTHPALDAALEHYNATGAAPYHSRSPEQIARLFGGLELTAPGMVPISRWRPDHSPFPSPEVPAWGGAGRKTPHGSPVL
jgi:S-adenosyl methyltransferase